MFLFPHQAWKHCPLCPSSGPRRPSIGPPRSSSLTLQSSSPFMPLSSVPVALQASLFSPRRLSSFPVALQASSSPFKPPRLSSGFPHRP
ncbi:hypothetical protein Bca4012_002945 [Brassica carinata]|uniref:BnaC03g72830D protein n=3 Tax=Brassica TaxID=3705 RepID=A0A078JXZ6_BRANA|nr:hypothetical protein F2Q68_00002136 [Brassica cretica]KAF3549630.1 hypothetical protein DY000_02002827 [Brassica cretica]CDY70537.1 BnaC03g72830D [Brassica napus]